MRNKTIRTLFLACILFFPELGFSQITQVPWQYPTGIDGYFLGMTKVDGVLYGQTAVGTYSSEDGELWYPCSNGFLKGVSVDSFSVGPVYPEVRWMKGCDKRILFPTYYHQIVSGSGPNMNITIVSQLVLGQIRKCNDGTVMIPVTYHFFHHDAGGTFSHDSEYTLNVNPDGTLDSLPSYADYFAHWGNQYVALSDSLYFFDDFTHVRLFSKPSPNVKSMSSYNMWVASTDSAFYVVLRDGTTYHTTNQGDTWETGAVNISSPIDGYLYRKGVHVVYDEDGKVYFSDDFANFTEVPQIEKSQVFYVDGVFWAAQSKRPDLLFRSLDLGQSWDTIFTEGVNGYKYESLLSYKDTIYAQNTSQFSLYQHQCGGEFQICLDKPFLLEQNVKVFHDKVFRSDWDGLYEYNPLISAWDTLILGKGQLQLDDKNMFYLSHDSLFYSDDLGESWSASLQIAKPSHGFDIAAVGDTMVLSKGTWLDEGVRLFYSLNRGQSWDDLELSSSSMDTSYVTPVVVSKENHFLFFYDSLYLYSDITAAPDVAKPLFDLSSRIKAFSFKNDFLVKDDNQIFQVSGLDSIKELDFGFGQLPDIMEIVSDSIGSKVFMGAESYPGIFWTSDYFFSESADYPIEEYASCDPIEIGENTYYVSGTYVKEKPEPCAQDTILKLMIAPPVVEVDTSVEVVVGDTVQGVVIGQDTMFSIVEYGQLGCDSLIWNYSVSTLVAISDESGESIQIGPNPVKDRLMINLGDFRADVLRIFNAAGQPVYGQKLDSGLLYLDVHLLPKGNYYLMVEQTLLREKRVVTFQKF